ncbi:hypothetical protein CANCADRAFT_27294, partial [Tortispora caseinolytica NRRL Y-17796]
NGPVVGTSTEILKPYLRLTSAPDPHKVRPQPVLEKALQYILTSGKADGNYQFACDQLKSIRQDLTVQHIKNKFTVFVYETHARMALEAQDLGEYNQCHSQLKRLYEIPELKDYGKPLEFVAYRILYTLHTQTYTDLHEILGKLSAEEMEDTAVSHALNVAWTIIEDNFVELLSLYKDPPNMNGCLMSCFMYRERVKALAKICKAYRPYIRLSELASMVGYKIVQDFKDDFGSFEMLQDNDDAIIEFKALYPLVEQARNSMRKVDIKGQI